MTTIITHLEAKQVGDTNWARIYVCARGHRMEYPGNFSESQALAIDGRYDAGEYCGPYPTLACSVCR